MVETAYDSYGNVTTVKNYDFGAGYSYPPSGTILSETDTSYADFSVSTCGTGSTYIRNLPCSITTYTSGTQTQQVSYTYTSGHPTKTITYVNSNSSLTSTATYNSNGTLASVKEANTGTTTYGYNTTGNFTGCPNPYLPTSTTLPDGFTTYQSWNCDGGVLRSSQDQNSQLTNYGYVDQSQSHVADPYWRVLSTTDPLGNMTTTTYSPTSAPLPTVETALLFNNNSSTVDVLKEYDGIGRLIVSEHRTAPNAQTFDQAVGYGYLGATNLITAQTTIPGGTGTTYTYYDALNRPYGITEDSGRSIANTYSGADILTKLGPLPGNGENYKQKQMEYDGIGRLTSVCELTGSGNGGGNCAQDSAQTGYWTTYSYGLSNGLPMTTVVQNAQAQSQNRQTRLYYYDGLNRLTQENNPETGTTNYTYDSETAVCNITNNSGDLVKKVDALNTTCYAHDTSHRLTNVTYPSGQYSTPSKTFVYDTTTIAGSCAINPNAAYVAGRLAEAFTGPSTAKITDIAYCYSPRGEVADVFETTPNSGGTYHTSASYFANGTLQNLNGIPSHSVFTFGLDGEGRLIAADTAGSNPQCNSSHVPLQCASYNGSGQPTGVTLGSGDSDAWTYDANTGRMKQYQ